ncbi:hypothetical protein T261_8542 [Streptomyces lydicus]|nr:hypothetical protein T261_8542 [Streptomyces lydicus]
MRAAASSGRSSGVCDNSAASTSSRTSPPPPVTKAWAETGFRAQAIDHGARLGNDVEITQRDPGQQSFKVIPRRWSLSGPPADS